VRVDRGIPAICHVAVILHGVMTASWRISEALDLISPNRVLVTGARGQLAGAIIEAYRDAHVLACSHDDLDIADHDAVMSLVERERPDAIFNCASFNHVDRAEEEPERAMNVNAFGVRNLVRAVEGTDTTLVHYSSDFVFDGKTARPYGEEDIPNPQSVYAQSKLLGDWFALEAPRAFVLRVESLFGGANAKSSVDRIVDAIRSGQEARVFKDRTVSPSFVVDVAAASKALVERGAPGLYHCVSTGSATWHDLAREIARIVGNGSEAAIVPISVADVSLKASRPQYAALANDKLTKIVDMPTWQDALRRYLAQFRARASDASAS
jgi:dTDP-4-dehydrorhamnose reductase